MGKTVTMNVKVKDYTNRVLGVVKEKYGLKDKGEALDRFAEMYGDEYVDKEVREEYVQKLLRIEKEHSKKHGNRRMSDKKLDKLFGK
ncbi:MAG TPA: antitoxin [archaeon]|nr:antitoxin [archaeon]